MTTADTTFVPADLDGSRWENLEPLYRDLLERPLRCESCLERLLLDRSELDAAASEARARLYTAMTCDTESETKKNAYIAFIEHVGPKLQETSFALDRRIVECEHVSRLDRDRYAVMLRDLEADVRLFREENIPLKVEDAKLGQRYAEVAGAMMVAIDGEELTLPQAGKRLEDTDRAVREKAWRAIGERRLRDAETMDDILDEMIRVRHRMAVNAGFDNFRDYAFAAKHRFDYGPAECEAFHRAAAEVCVPVLRRLNAERKRSLAVEPLRPWDLAVDVKGRPPLRPFKDGEELAERAARLFHALDGELGGMFESLRDGTSLDLDSRKGKAPGGYQESFDRVRKPFIFMNAAGTQRDVETMVHEAGHAFHSMLSRDDDLLHYRHSPIEFAEVASMGMELLAFPHYGAFHDERNAARAQRSHLEDLARTLPWIATVDAFQHWMYLNPEHTREERRAKWIELDARFGAAVSWEGFELQQRTTWHRQLHIFEVPFYYIEYGIAQLGALQLWLRSRRDPAAALANYKRALALGGSRPLPELFAAAGLRFDFGPDTMRELMNEVSTVLADLAD